MVRFSLGDAVRKNIVFSGLRLIPHSEKGDILVPSYKGTEEKDEAINFLRLWSLWAIGVGFSADLTKKILDKYIKVAFRLPFYEEHATWDDFIDSYYTTHRLSAAEEFKQWYTDTVQKARVLITWYSYRELEVATDFFSSANWLGRGAEEEVFKGRYEEIGDVAVKCFKSLPGESLTRVLAEVSLHRQMGRDSFPDIVHVLGYSTSKCPLLVLEFMNNGNLRHHLEGVHGTYLLHHPRARLSVAIDIANALVQLHFTGPWPIYHRDVRSTNILLDSSWKAKLTDMGLAVMVKSEVDKRTPSVAYSQGYEDPVYLQTGVLDGRTDVWSFGVVLMELVTFLKVWDPQRKPERSLSELVINRTKSGNSHTLIRYPPGKADQHASDVLEKMMDVALRCCSKDMEQRPSIDQVANDLQEFRSHWLPRKKWVVDENQKSAPVDRGCIGWKWELEPYPHPF